MAKKPTKPPALADPEVAQEIPVLTRVCRATRVLISQGRAPGLLPGMSAELQEKLAGCCSLAGEVLPTAVAVVSEVLIEHYKNLKATVDDDQPAAESTNQPPVA